MRQLTRRELALSSRRRWWWIVTGSSARAILQRPLPSRESRGHRVNKRNCRPELIETPSRCVRARTNIHSATVGFSRVSRRSSGNTQL